VDLIQKVQALGESAQHDLCNSCGMRESRRQDDLGRWVYPAALPNGGSIRLLKVLLTNVCEKNCYYCGIRARRDVPRTSFTPDELARGFDQMNRAGLVDGIFLSSAVCEGPSPTMDGMIAAIELLRKRYEFTGYVHLKLLPGCSEAHVERAMQLAHRVSVNLEAPSAERLARIAPRKVFYEELTRPMEIASRLLRQAYPATDSAGTKGSEGSKPGTAGGRFQPRGSAQARRGGPLAPSGQTTQFVVGAAGESDQEILSTTWRLYRDLGVARAYFSAFQPVPGTPLDGLPPAPTWREHRLYQADWLLRLYGFGYEDLIFDGGGNLPQRADPKRLYGLRHPELFPVEVNRAVRQELLRVPGIGPGSAGRIIELRHLGTLRSLEDLARMGADAVRAAPFVLLDGKRPPFQLPLWEDDG